MKKTKAKTSNVQRPTPNVERRIADMRPTDEFLKALRLSSPASPGFAVGGRAIYIDRGRKTPKFIDGEEV